MNKTSKFSFTGIITFLFFVLLGGIVGVFSAGASIVYNVFPILVFIPTIICVFILIFIGIAIHELGHLIFGLVSGYNFLSFRIGPFVLVKYKNKYSVRFFSTPESTGQCILIPPKYNNGDFPYKLYSFGGLILNLVGGILSILLSLLPGIHFSLKYVLIVSAIINFFMIIINAIPSKNIINNDGSNILALTSSKECRRDFWLQLKLNSIITKGKKYSEIPDQLLELPTHTNIFSYYVYFTSAIKEMELKNYRLAENILSNIDNNPKYPYLLKSLSDYDLLSCKIILNKDYNYQDLSKELESLMTKDFYSLDKKSKNSLARISFWILYYKYIEQDSTKVKTFIDEFNKVCKKHPILGEAKSRKIILHNIINKKH